MEQITKNNSNVAALYQSWTRQPFERNLVAPALNILEELENAFYFYTKGKQFVYVYDFMAGEMVFVSRNVNQVLGYGQEEINPEFFFRIMHPDDHDQVLKITRAAGDLVIQDKQVDALTLFVTVDCRMQHADGHYIKMSRQTSILKRDEQGNIRFSLGIFTDIDHLNRGDEVNFDVSMPEYKAKMFDILASYEPAPAQGEFSLREKQVLRLMALGKNTREIANDLSLSSFTIDTHRKNMKKKLKVRNTAELITTAISRKIIQY